MRPSWIEIDLGAVRHNTAVIAADVAPAVVCAVVKADAYGHGDVPVAEAALDGGATWLAVALVEEGARLREAGIDAPILLLSEPALEDVAEVAKWSLTPTVYRTEFLDALRATATSEVRIHLKVDTGMHRVGADPPEAFEIARVAWADPSIRLEGVWTHLSVADEDAEFTKRQVGALQGFVAALTDQGIAPDMVHVANTPGALLYPEARFDMVRIGLGIYGLRPAPDTRSDLDLRPAMRVVSEVAYMRRLPAAARPSYGRIRELTTASNVATVPVGYADGIPRRLGPLGATALIGGKRRQLAGSVTMDQVLFDVGDDDVAVGDEVVFIGRQGDDEITADEWAALLETINYEITCQFGPRLPRRYRQ